MADVIAEECSKKGHSSPKGLFYLITVSRLNQQMGELKLGNFVAAEFYGVPMSHISIEVTDEQYERLETLASLHGITLKQYLLRNALPEGEEEEALRKLESFLDDRLQQAVV